MIYESKACPRRRSGNGKEEKVFDALEWLAAMGSHVPDKGEQMVRYYGYYSNVSRGKRKKETEDALIPPILEPEYPMDYPYNDTYDVFSAMASFRFRCER